MSEPSEFSSGQHPGNLSCLGEEWQGGFDEIFPHTSKKGKAGCREPLPALCWVRGWWPDPAKPYKFLGWLCFSPYPRKKKDEEDLESFSTEKSEPCSSWTKPEPLWQLRLKLDTSASPPLPPRFTHSSPKEGLWMLVKQCHPTFPDPAGLVCSKPTSEVFSSSSLIAQWTFLWAKLMHFWKSTAHLQPQMVKTKEFLLALDCVLWAIHKIFAVGESFPPPQTWSPFVELSQATS